MVLRYVFLGFEVSDHAHDDSQDSLRARAGDREAFARLVTRHQKAVYGLCARLLRHGDEARDAAQEAFVRAWERRASFDPARDFGAWVLGIARNAAIDRLRRSGRNEELGEIADPAPPADDALDELRGEDALWRALADLAPIYREVVELVYVQGRAVAEAAAILGAPQGTVMTRLFRARRLLRERLGAGA